MIEGFAVLLACQLAGETLARLLALPFPGPVPGIVVSLAPMSVTARVAMALAERARGIPTLAAALVICTGIVGAAIVTPLMNALGLKDFAARGFAAGLAAHGIGTARACQVDSSAGAFAGIAIGLDGSFTALALPLILRALDQLWP